MKCTGKPPPTPLGGPGGSVSLLFSLVKVVAMVGELWCAFVLVAVWVTLLPECDLIWVALWTLVSAFRVPLPLPLWRALQ